MDVDLVRVRRNFPGRAQVSVLVKTHGRPAETVDVDILEPHKVEKNVFGWVRHKNGEFVNPYTLVDGRWVWTLPISETARIPLTDEEVADQAKVALRDHHHRHVVDHCNDTGFDEYVDQGVRVVPKTPVHLDERTGMVQVVVEAFRADTGEELNVGDGIFQFDRPPMYDHGKVKHPANRLKRELARVIRGLNGMDL